MAFKVQQEKARRIAGFHLVGPWEQTVTQGFQQLLLWATAHELEGEWLAVYYDDPDITPAEELRCTTALSVSDDFVLPEGSEGMVMTEIAAGSYAVGLARIENDAYFQAWERLFDELEADSSLTLTGKPCFERYLNDGTQTGVWDIEMYVPVATGG